MCFRSLWPLLAFCLLSVVGLAVATIIILSLIPLYLSEKDVEINNDANAGKDLFGNDHSFTPWLTN